MKHVLTLALLLLGTVESFGLRIVECLLTPLVLLTGFQEHHFHHYNPKWLQILPDGKNHSGWESRTFGVDFGSFELVPCYGLCISNPQPSPKCWAICPFSLLPCLEIGLYLGSCALVWQNEVHHIVWGREAARDLPGWVVWQICG